jgi:Protein of unknown function (DUF3738).
MWIGSCVAIACVVVTLSAQQRKPTFDVVSVKPVQRPNVPEAMEQAIEQMIAASWGRQGGALRVAAAHVQTLIQFAYEIESYQIIGGPDWMRTDWFAIDARPGAEVSEGEAKRMTQSLLEDRFKLVTHEEQRDMKFYALVRARADGRLGPYIRQFGKTCTREMADEAKKAFPPHDVDPQARGWSFMRADCSPGFASVARNLSVLFKDLPVLDETGLTGRFTYDVQYISSGTRITDVKNALEEQLGLTLAVKHGPIAVRIIDSVQQPTEN